MIGLRSIKPDFTKWPSDSGRRRAIVNQAFRAACIAIASVSVVILMTLLGTIAVDGFPALSWAFLTGSPSPNPEQCGILPALMGSIWICLGCAALAVPLGVGTAVFLEEFPPRGRWMRRFHELVELNISNLSGVPSIVYGILGLTAFANMFGYFGRTDEPVFEIGARHYYQFLTEGLEVVLIPVANPTVRPELVDGMTAQHANGRPVTLRVVPPDGELPSDEAALKFTLWSDAEGGLATRTSWYYFRLPFGRSILAASLTLMLVVLPILIISTQEALRGVPSTLREASLGLGSTTWQTVWNVTLPSAVPGIMTGTILAVSRAIGEAAPILMLAGIVYITRSPQHLCDDFAVLPIQIYYWAGLPVAQNAPLTFTNLAAAGIIVLLAILLVFNAVAIAIRQFNQRPLT
jgi:phosphate transport system permease protein